MLRSVHRQLAGQRWERRLARFTIAVLLIGSALNWSVGWGDHNLHLPASQFASRPSSQAIVEVAVAIGRATDAETGSSMARHLAALSGTPLSPEQAAAIDLEIQRRVKPGALVGKEGSS